MIAPPTLAIHSYSQMMIGVSNNLLSIVFRFHYHSQKVIGSLGDQSTSCFLANLEIDSTERQPVLPRSPSPRGKNKSMSMGFGQIIPNT